MNKSELETESQKILAKKQQLRFFVFQQRKFVVKE